MFCLTKYKYKLYKLNYFMRLLMIKIYHKNSQNNRLPAGSPSTAKNSKFSTILCCGRAATNQLQVRDATPLLGPS